MKSASCPESRIVPFASPARVEPRASNPPDCSFVTAAFTASSAARAKPVATSEVVHKCDGSTTLKTSNDAPAGHGLARTCSMTASLSGAVSIAKRTFMGHSFPANRQKPQGDALNSAVAPRRAGSVALVAAHVRRLGQSMFSQRLFERRPLRSFRQFERRRIQREHAEKVTMRTACLGRARASVASLAEIVETRFSQRRRLVSFGDRMDVRRDVPEEPVIPGAARSIRIVNNQGETFCAGRLPGPVHRRRYIHAVARETFRYIGGFRKAFDDDFKSHRVPPRCEIYVVTSCTRTASF